jgi:hypothetical protein
VRAWTLAAAVALLAAACGGGSPKLDALEADPLATYRPVGATEVERNADAESDGGQLGKPSEARAERLYTVDDPQAAFADAVRAAQASGWTADSTEPPAAVLSKRLPTGRATATITLLTDQTGLPDGVDPPVLAVTLTHH